MMTREIKGKLYRLIKIPDYTNKVKAVADESDPEYTWLHCDKSIRKRVKLNLSKWHVIGPIGMIDDNTTCAIWLMPLATFVADSGMEEHQALLLVEV